MIVIQIPDRFSEIFDYFHSGRLSSIKRSEDVIIRFAGGVQGIDSNHLPLLGCSMRRPDIEKLRDLLQKLACGDEELVLIVQQSNTIILCDLNEIESKFKSLKCGVLVGCFDYTHDNKLVRTQTIKSIIGSKYHNYTKACLITNLLGKYKCVLKLLDRLCTCEDNNNSTGSYLLNQEYNKDVTLCKLDTDNNIFTVHKPYNIQKYVFSSKAPVLDTCNEYTVSPDGITTDLKQPIHNNKVRIFCNMLECDISSLARSYGFTQSCKYTLPYNKILKYYRAVGKGSLNSKHNTSVECKSQSEVCSSGDDEIVNYIDLVELKSV